MPEPFGRRETRDGATYLVLDIDVAHPRDRVWHAVATPPGLAPWLGELADDPARAPVGGTVMFRMTAEGEDAPVEPVEIGRCDAPVAYDVVAGVAGGAWHLGVAIDETPGGSRLTLTHRADDPAGFDMYGPGWEFYLHRLRAHLDGDDLSTVSFDDYVPNAGHYAGLFGIEPTDPADPAAPSDPTAASGSTGPPAA